MDQDHLTEEDSRSSGCANCGHMVIDPGYPTPLCKECRTKFIRYPIPIGIKVFAGLVVAAMIIALFRLPGNLSAAVHYQRGKDAIAGSNYLTADKELGEVVKKMPGFQEAKEYRTIATFYNQNFSAFITLVSDLQGKKVEEESLYQEISDLTKKVSDYLPNDSFMAIIEKYHSMDSIPDGVCHQYMLEHTDEMFPAARYATFLLDNHRLQECDTILDDLLRKDPNYINALALKTGLKRELGQIDSAHYYCDKILALNKESAFGTASKARTYLKEKKDAEGMKWALKNIELRRNDPYSLATLALAYHLNNMTGDRDKLLEAAKKDSTQMESMQYVIDIMNGKQKFR